MTILSFAIAYFLGSIPFGLLITRFAGMGDVRNIGSGNIGATNVMRTGNKKLGILTLLCDAGKGAAAVCIARSITGGDYVAAAGLFAVLGHVFPIWLKFKGGKGVATALGVFFALSLFLGLSVCVVWLLAFSLSRMASVASIAAVAYSPLVGFILGDTQLTILCFGLALLVIYTHRGNIKRIREGTERGFRKEVP